jgi:ribonucleotide monophosphatase NagD (HAD superfamily)
MEKLDEFYQTAFWKDVLPIPGAKEGLARLISEGYSISVVTARGENQRAATEEFLEKWFPGWVWTSNRCMGVADRANGRTC